MSHLCLPSSCCASCKPRYKRLVDSIYPRQPPFDTPLGGNMQKLTFYSISHPEKLNRIGIYFIQRLSRDLTRQRVAEVKVTVDAMERLLKSCHGSPSLNQFIEGYLLMVQRLLETNNAHMEKLATDLFERFSTIEEDSPSYHRQYDFFISKFSAMCHAQNDVYVRSQRYNGLRGLRGVIWKSASDDLQANIWEKQHMNKIVPSILFNFQHDDESEELEPPPQQDMDQSTGMLFNADEPGTDGEKEPRILALQCLRELFQKCSFGSLKSVLEPVFHHFDLHHKWDPPATFATKTFKAILYSIQSQNSYFVIQELINQLELQPTTASEVRVGMATVLARIVSIAGTSIGPLLLAIFNSLLKQLRCSVEFQQSRQCTNLEAERVFQDTLINALGDFANALPDYQKVEIMMFTAASIPTIAEGIRSTKNGEKSSSIKLVQTSEAFLQKVLVKTLLQVATKYKTLYLATVFTDAFLKTLLQLQLTSDAEVRLIAQRIFQTLLDRHENQARLEHIHCVAELDIELQLTVEKCSRQDQLFMRRHIYAIISALYRSCAQACHDRHNQQHSAATDDAGSLVDDQLDAVLCSMALLCTEVSNDDETVVELLRLGLAFQLMALENGAQICCAAKLSGVHNLVAKFMHLCSRLLSIPALCQHVQQVIMARKERAHPSLNIVGGGNAAVAATAQKSALTPVVTVGDQPQQSADVVIVVPPRKMPPTASAAFSPPVGRAPIAHMDSEENDLGQVESSSVDVQQQMTTKSDEDADISNNGTVVPSRQTVSSGNERMGGMDLIGEPALLFSVETIFEAINASNKFAQRLLQPFKPLPLAQLLSGSATVGNVYLLQNGAHSKIGGLSTPLPYNSLISAFTPSAAGGSSSSTSGGMMFSSPLDSCKTEEANETGGDSNSTTQIMAMEEGGDTAKNDGQRTSSLDATSVGSSSVDWSPPESRKHSRRNTALGGGAAQQQALTLPITVEQLRIFANSPIDVAEEERLDQEKSRKVLELYRGKTVKQLEALLFQQQQQNGGAAINCNCANELTNGENGTGAVSVNQHHHHQPNCAAIATTKTPPTVATEAVVVETLAQAVHRLTQRHEEKCKVREFGQQGPAATIFDIKFPSNFEM
ncbi:hypothetical protein niasHS_005348 [Heterodera schachtii]|uniref:Uncharacterized protein n=2 Tax=Heterodera TaxID=34509 RepID=A0ABD2J934_HETSC